MKVVKQGSEGFHHITKAPRRARVGWVAWGWWWGVGGGGGKGQSPSEGAWLMGKMLAVWLSWVEDGLNSNWVGVDFADMTEPKAQACEEAHSACEDPKSGEGVPWGEGGERVWGVGKGGSPLLLGSALHGRPLGSLIVTSCLGLACTRWPAAGTCG